MYTPFEIGTRFRILPPGSSPSGDGRTDLVLTRGAFGSGEHETTASCLGVMETLPEIRGTRLLDLGSGTGVLALGALKLGAAHAVCVDISPDAVATARENASLNGLDGQITHVVGSLAQVRESSFGLVLANIYGDLLLEFAAGLVARARPGALLLLSGILWEYNFEVRQCYEKAGCEVLRNCMLEQFSTVLLRKSR